MWWWWWCLVQSTAITRLDRQITQTKTSYSTFGCSSLRALHPTKSGSPVKNFAGGGFGWHCYKWPDARHVGVEIRYCISLVWTFDLGHFFFETVYLTSVQCHLCIHVESWKSHCVVLKGKYHCWCERNRKATTAASTESTRVVWYGNLLFVCLLHSTHSHIRLLFSIVSFMKIVPHSLLSPPLSERRYCTPLRVLLHVVCNVQAKGAVVLH